MRLDARIPVRILSPAAGPAVWPAGLPEADPQGVLLLADPAVAVAEANWAAVRPLPEAGVAAGIAHPLGCACCVARSPLALLFSSLFEQRARGTLSLFRRVWLVAPAPLAESVRALLVADPLVAGRYRPGEF